MADENAVGILVSVDLDAAEALKQLAQLRGETTALKQQQKELDRTTAEGAVEYERLGAQIKSNTATMRNYEKEVVNTLKQEQFAAGSIKGLRVELSNAKLAYAELSKAEREGAQGRELLEKTAALNAELKSLESSYGDNQRKVGEYENAGKSLRTEMRELVQSLTEMKVAGQDQSAEYQSMAGRLADLRDAMGDVNQQANQMASDTNTFDTMVQGVQAVTAAYGLWQSTSTALGIENEALDQSMQKMVVVMGALQSLTTLQNLAQKQSNLYRTSALILQKLGLKQTTGEAIAKSANVVAIQAEAAAENASTIAKAKGVVVTGLATAAQWLWNAALAANPVVLILAGVMALIAGIGILIGVMGRESQAAKDAAVAEEAYNAELEASEGRLKNLDNAHANSVRERNLASRKLIEQMKAEGASQEELDDAKRASETGLRNLEIEYQKQRREESRSLVVLKTKELGYWVEAQKGVREGGKRWKEYAEKIKEAQTALDDLKQTQADTDLSIRESKQDQIDAERAAEEATRQASKERAEAAKARVDAAITAYEKELDAQKRFNESQLRAEAEFQNDDFATRQSYERRLFDLNAYTERAKLDNLRKNNRISEAEYQSSLEIMSAQLREFSNKQIADQNAFFEGERQAILGVLSKTLDDQIAETEKKYTDAFARLSAVEPPTMLAGEDELAFAKRLADYEDFELKKINIAIRLENQRNDEVAVLREAADNVARQHISDALNAEYSADLDRYSDNEAEKLRVTKQMLEERIEMLRAAGQSTLVEEAQLRSTTSQLNAIALARELRERNLNLRQQHDARKAALEQELQLYAGNRDKQAEILAAMAENDKAFFDAQMESARVYTDGIFSVLGAVNDFLAAMDEREMEQIDSRYNAQQAALDKQLNAGLISQKKYDDETLRLEKSRAKEENKLKRDQAKRDKALQLMQATIAAALAITSAMTLPPPASFIMAALTAAATAAQIATIAATPLPKAARGGLISGPAHSAGGTIIEAEGGEAIMTRRAVSMFGPVLSALNQLGGGVPFTAPLSDGGYTLRASTVATPGEDVVAAIRDLKIFTAVTDINLGQAKFAEIQGRGDLI